MRKFYLLFLTSILLACNGNNTPERITIPVERITPTKDQKERRERSEAYCKSYGIPVYNNPTALFVDPENKVTIRTKDEIVKRTLALCYIGLKGEGLGQKDLDKFAKDYNIPLKLTPGEKVYVTTKQPTKQQAIDATWKYEDLHVMLWALGFIDTLSYPDQFCNVANDVKIIFDLSEEDFTKKANLRSKKEILDQADLILRLDWACVEARVKNKPPPGNLDKGVVYERHYSLNWLINYMDQGWDDVTTDT